MAHRSQSSSVGENPLDPNYLPPHYREEYRLAIDALIEDDIQGYYEFLQTSDVVNFLAQPEIEHIKSVLQTPNKTSNAPELTYHDGTLGDDGSSDTYWPMHSDLAAPGLDMGWPMQQHSFVGPTEVTTLVNPSDPDMPSIKEQARRLIKSAQQVIGVVMDMFTDVDIFADLLDAAARHVPVYILLDEQNAHHFVAMVSNCKVNLDLVQMMRVRTVSGVTYFCQTGKSFKGQVKDRFLLSDCRAVLSGNYSFMWSYEKIHRCIAHLFLGELVATFDEEFRILFAQSQPLSVDHALVPHVPSETSSTSSYFSSQFGLKRTQSMRNNRGFLRQPELSFPYGDPDRNNALPFRRDEPFRHTMDPTHGITIGKFAASQQFRLQQSFLEQGRSIVSKQMEVSAGTYKRHSYAEGTQESYSSSKQYMKQRVMSNLEEAEQHYHREQTQTSHFYGEGPGPGSGHGHYDRLRGRGPHLAIDRYSDSSYPLELEPPPPGNYGRDYLSSEDLRNEPHQVGGRYGGGSAHKRPSVGQAYACQSSPTQPHPPEKQVFPKTSNTERDPDPEVRQGLRNWRINSYLSTFEDGGEEGLPQPMGPDAFEEPQSSYPPNILDSSGLRYGSREPQTAPSKPRQDVLKPRFGKPIMLENTEKELGRTSTNRDLVLSGNKSSALEQDKEEERERERDWERGGTQEVGVDVKFKEAPEITLSKHESFRSRVNPLLQRSSRLRSSLIFSSSKVENHSSGLGLQPATEEDDTTDPIRTSSIVAQILAKRNSMSRDPFVWRKKAEERQKEKEKEEEVRVKEDSQHKKEPFKSTEELAKNMPNVEEKMVVEPPKPQPLLNMNDPASRLQYFQELAAKRKASKVETEPTSKAPEPAPKKPDHSDTSPPSTTSVPSGVVNPPESEPKKPDVSAKLAELTRRASLTSAKPFIPTKPSATQRQPLDTSNTQKEEHTPEVHKKEHTRSLKPLPSPKFFKRDKPLKMLNPRRVSSCGEEILTTDATDAEKSELKKSRSNSMTHADSKESLQKMGSITSLNTLEGKSEGKLDFLKKQTQRLKGFLGPKDKRSAGTTATSGDEKAMSTVLETTEETSDKKTNHKASAKANVNPSRYQTSSGSVLFSSNLRDDTKVILEQISANSQKKREEAVEAEKGSDKGEKGTGALEREPSIKRNHFMRPQPNPEEREGLLKRIESMRKEKKVYSRFEMGNNLG
ncbi:protein FAM83H [Aplochiton taeniatus]